MLSPMTISSNSRPSLEANAEPMSDASIDRERRLQRVVYAVIHEDGAEPEVLIARDRRRPKLGSRP